MRRIAVRSSRIHGRGVFTLRPIVAGELIIEYAGQVISAKEAQRRFERSVAEDGHTFFFGLDGGRVIDGAHGGNSARWINHSCRPNAEAEEAGSRVFIRALRDIPVGAEIFIDYSLEVEGRRTAALKAAYACRCNARHCRGTMLAPR
ncbi:SET domain-containing protein-lysine N-methyltransferase [Caballeronia sp. LP003]|uniref:SET domain-containing protein n=1 Tax=Caballeronia sp. LP003 TaxID=3038551 RepID=UPI002865FB8F|nr:SET domain-containing protein-lysine N-methyltransferase [Caballeronia sp. LP003]MDR5785238.1 SET domain-containing protein-lysine N-methyltransferase [Caballeronia sp. LP003]